MDVSLLMMKTCSWSLHEEGCGQEMVGWPGKTCCSCASKPPLVTGSHRNRLSRQLLTWFFPSVHQGERGPPGVNGTQGFQGCPGQRGTKVSVEHLHRADPEPSGWEPPRVTPAALGGHTASATCPGMVVSPWPGTRTFRGCCVFGAAVKSRKAAPELQAQSTDKDDLSSAVWFWGKDLGRDGCACLGTGLGQ